MNDSQQPFIKRREVSIYCPGAEYFQNDVPRQIKAKVCHELWSPDALSRYLDMLQAFGFNSIQISACTQPYVNTGVTPEELRTRDLHLLKAARARGMTATWFLWANVCYDPKARDPRYPVTRFDQCWHDPTERAFLEDYYRYQSQFAPDVDHLVTHWADPGGGKPGCERCDYRGALELHNAIQAIFRERNPRLRTTFSTWMLISAGFNRWPGLNLDTVLHSGILAPDVGVAIGLMNCGADGRRLDSAGQLKREDIAAIRGAGRTAGIWGWYTTDRETSPSLHVSTDILQNYFRSLVAPSGGWIDWHSVDDNCQGLNIQNLYVAGRLMQDPQADARAVLAEFLRQYFGEEIAQPVAAALRVVEKARAESLCYDVQIGDPSEALHLEALRDTRELTGSLAWRQTVLEMAEAAAQRLERVGVRAGHVPPFPTPLTPAQYLEELKAQLRAIAQFMRFLIKTEQVWQLIHRKAAPEIVAEAIARLPEVESSSEHLIHLEQWMVRREKETLRKHVCPPAGSSTAKT